MDESGLGLGLNDSSVSEADLVKEQISDEEEVRSHVNEIPPPNDLLCFKKIVMLRRTTNLTI